LPWFVDERGEIQKLLKTMIQNWPNPTKRNEETEPLAFDWQPNGFFE
jgi:hypothetical protein